MKDIAIVKRMQIMARYLLSLHSDPGQVESPGLTPGIEEHISPSIVKTLPDMVLAADVGQRTLALETLQNCRQLGVGINLPALHIHP